MPLAAYFRNVGAALLVLLFVANFALPAPPVVARTTVYPPVIRIHSDRKWPERVTFDTTMAIASARPAAGYAEIAASSGANDVPASPTDAVGVRAAFAMLPRADSPPAQSVDQDKRHLKQRPAVKTARKHARPQIVLVARQRQFGWFDTQPRYLR
jgi:hypothetical protein